MNNNTCANCAYWGCKMKFPSWHMDYCGKIDGPSCDTLMNRDDYCGDWEPKEEEPWEYGDKCRTVQQSTLTSP